MCSTKKIEIKDGKPVVDRVLNVPVPISYGYIPGTLAEDGDALDIFVISNKYLNTGDLVQVRIIGMFECLDQGVSDNKILAVIEGESCNETICGSQVANYLLNYKSGFELLGWKKIKSLKELDKYKV